MTTTDNAALIGILDMIKQHHPGVVPLAISESHAALTAADAENARLRRQVMYYAQYINRDCEAAMLEAMEARTMDDTGEK